jgi:hypothetical protein
MDYILGIMPIPIFLNGGGGGKVSDLLGILIAFHLLAIVLLLIACIYSIVVTVKEYKLYKGQYTKKWYKRRLLMNINNDWLMVFYMLGASCLVVDVVGGVVQFGIWIGNNWLS